MTDKLFEAIIVWILVIYDVNMLISNFIWLLNYVSQLRYKIEHCRSFVGSNYNELFCLARAYDTAEWFTDAKKKICVLLASDVLSGLINGKSFLLNINFIVIRLAFKQSFCNFLRWKMLYDRLLRENRPYDRASQNFQHR